MTVDELAAYYQGQAQQHAANSLRLNALFQGILALFVILAGLYWLSIALGGSSGLGSAASEVRVVEDHWASGAYGVRSVAGTVENSSLQSFGYVQVEINLYDDQGTQVGSTLANVNNLAAGGKWQFEAPVLQESATRYEVKKVTAF